MQTASLGEWVRRRRKTLDLTQAELARRVACAPITIRKIEADERRPSRVMAEAIARALGLEADDRDRFVAAARAVRSPLHLPAPAAAASFEPAGRLPHPPNPLIGRSEHLTAVIDLLAPSGGPARMVTIVGPPGVGKTRLAVEVARRSEHKLDLPSAFVDLTLAERADDVPARIASAVSTPTAAMADVETLAIAALRRTPVLLVLDNVEHVIDAAPHLAHLVEQCPDLICLATSRHPLEVYGEHVHRLEPFDLDDPDQAAAAVSLFASRVRATGRRAPEPDDSDLAAICRALDGLPLAIELAALQLRDQSPSDLLETLRAWDPTLSATTRGRSERLSSATGAVAWSHRLLTPAARLALSTASVFVAPFAPEDLSELHDPSDRDGVRAALDELAEHALVTEDPATCDIRLLAVVREFGRSELRREGRESAVRSDHARLVAERVDALSPGIEAWPERSTIEALARWDAEVRAALVWSFGPGGDDSCGRRILGAIIPFWHFAGLTKDALTWAEAAHAAAVTHAAPDRYRDAYYLATARWAAGSAADGRELIRDAAAGAAAAGDITWAAETIGMEQLLALASGDLATADALTGACLAAADRAGGEWQLLAHLRATTLDLIHGRLGSARAHCLTAQDLAESNPSSWGRGSARGVQGDLHLAEGDPKAAASSYLAAAELFCSTGAAVYAIARIAGVANALVAAGAIEPAARIYGLVDSWSDDLGAPLHPLAQMSTAIGRAEAETALGPRFPVLLAAGRELPQDLTAVERLARDALR